jgi:hypothetical protein
MFPRHESDGELKQRGGTVLERLHPASNRGLGRHLRSFSKPLDSANDFVCQDLLTDPS